MAPDPADTLNTRAFPMTEASRRAMITPPTARRTGRRRFREVLAAFTIAEIEATQELTVRGFARWALEPLSFMLVYFVLVGEILDRPQHAFLLFLLCALVPWRYFTAVTTRAGELLRGYRDEIANRAFPRVVLPLVPMAVEAITLVASLVLFVPLMALYRVPPRLSLLWIPVLLCLLLLLVAGPSYMMSLAGLYFPDYRGVSGNLIRAGFFASTGLVPLDAVPNESLRLVLRLNPFSGIFDSFRRVVIAAQPPRWIDLLYPAVVGAILLAVGLWLYRKREHQFPKEV